jgi:Xaa-Pro aminopeptidase
MNEKIRLLRERLRSLKMEGMIVTNPVSIKYLTNIENEGTLLITRKENIFLTYTMFLESVKNTVTINDEIIVADFRDVSKDEYENFFLFCENIGFEENYVTYKQYHYLKQKYRVNNLAETENIIEKLRAVKDQDEISKIKKACELTDKCFNHLLEFIKIGTTEKEIALEIEIFFRTNGAEGLAFDPVVAIGQNSANPHWKPTDRAVKMADLILIDMGCKYEGYCSDMTRTIFMGCILEEIKPVYDLVLKNQLYTTQEIKEYASIKTLSQMVESNFKLNNFDLIHSLGHSIGMETHEIPYINSKNDTFLKENMVIANEPGIYIPDKYGIRIEDTILVEKNGCTVLTKSPKNYVII